MSALSLADLLALYRQKKATPLEVVEAVIRRVEAAEPRLHALTHFDPEDLRAQARALAGDGPCHARPLWGVPVLIKDNICVSGVPTTCASKILEGFRPPYDATVVERLKKAGALLAGMANMDEFAFGSSCEHSAYGPTRNPWDPQRVPGGSSGGAAAAVAAGYVPLALGSDTGGSIRQPAAFCGVVGLKPTYGRVSRYGLVAFASSLDQVGPITREARDGALALRVLAGADPRDSTCAPVEVPDYGAELQKGIRGLRVGVPKEYFIEGERATSEVLEVQRAVRAAAEVFRAQGAQVREVSMPHTRYAVPTYYIVATAEASSNLSRFDGVQYGRRAGGASTLLEMYHRTRDEGFGPEAKRRILLGTFVLSSGYYEAYYGRAMRVRTLIKRDFERVFEEVDCLLTPTSPTPAFRLGEKLTDPLTMYLSDILTISANLAGVPALSVPCGFTRPAGGSEGNLPLPIGLQLMARPFEEGLLFRTACAYAEAAPRPDPVPSPPL